VLKRYEATGSERVFNLLVKDIQLSNTQKKLYYLFNSEYYYKSILSAHFYNTKVIYPLDNSWIKIFESNNVSVNWFLSNMLWKILGLFSILKSFIKVLLDLFTDKFMEDTSYIKSKERNVYFYDFPRSEEKNISLISKELNFHSWYFYAYMNDNNEDSLEDSRVSTAKDFNNTKYSSALEGQHIDKGYLFGEKSFAAEIEILYEFARVFIRNTLLLNFKTCYLILQNLPDLIAYKRLINYGKKMLVSKVIFNASLAFHKPIWVNALEKLDIDVDYFFYSVYSQPALNREQHAFKDGWQLCNWKKIFVIDERQKNDLKSVLKLDATIEVMPSIPNLSGRWRDSQNSYNSHVVFFDNNIALQTYHFGTLASIGYDEIGFQIDYLKTVIEAAAESDLLLVYKIKRPENQKLPPRYKQFLKEAKMKHPNNFIVVESDISPQVLIENAIAVICKPLSTTALIAKQNSSHVAFYDPTSKIDKNDPSLREIRTINSAEELRNFMAEKKI
jgi:polysaccharide biosynthesis PFTS motif protein